MNTVTTRTREELTDVAGVQGLLWRIARTFAPPPGYTHEDLVSEANVALCRSRDKYDPELGEFTTFAGAVAKHAILDLLRHLKARKRAGDAAAVPLQAETAAGETLPPPADPRQADPSEIAAVREMLAPSGSGRRECRRRLSVRQIEATLPTPAEVADQVVRLRAAMFAAVSEVDISDVMQAVVREAKAGCPRAAKLLIDLLAPGRSGVTVNQQAVVIQQGDLT